MRKPRIVAHCGDLHNAPESTLIAFSYAIEKGANAIEFDVHLTKDGELVVHHDFYLGRTSNGSGYIGDFTLAELKELDAGSWFSAEFAKQKIPTLGEVLELGKGKIRFEIELKGSSLAFLKQVIDAIVRFDVLDQVELTSAHIPLLCHIKQVNSSVRTGMFFSQFPEWMKPALGQNHILDWMALSNAQVAHLPFALLEKELAARLWENGLLVHGSNLNIEEEIEMGMALDIDQFSTDNLELALRKIDSRRNDD